MKVEYSDSGKNAVIHNSEIYNELRNVLSEEDIQNSRNIVNTVIKRQMLTTSLMFRKYCMIEGGECKYNKYPNKGLPSGNPYSDIMFVKKMPTELEQITSVSHSDSGGHFLMTVLSKLGIQPEMFYYTDFMKCYAGNKVDGVSCVHCMKNYFMKELEVIKPGLIIAEGMMVLKALNARIFESRVPEEYGAVFQTSVKGIPVSAACITDCEKAVKLSGDELRACKNALWVQINKIMVSYRNNRKEK